MNASDYLQRSRLYRKLIYGPMTSFHAFTRPDSLQLTYGILMQSCERQTYVANIRCQTDASPNLRNVLQARVR